MVGDGFARDLAPSLRTLVIVGCLVVGSAAGVLAQTESEMVSDEETIRQINRKVLEDLLVNADPEALDNVALEEYLVVAPGGRVETKKQAIAGVGSLDVESIEITDEQVVLRGDTALLVGKLVADGTMQPLGRLPPMKFFTVFLKVEGEWKMLGRSLTACAPVAVEHGVC